jgi:hypothetical membrane protein
MKRIQSTNFLDNFRMVKRQISFGASVFLLLIYGLFTILSLLKFPAAYSPLNNWLSDLGNIQLNPDGAAFYNMGIVITGLALLPFFLGLSAWKMNGNRRQNAMLLLTQAFGCLGGLAMILSAVFPINIQGVHTFWSAALYILLGTAFAFSAAALRYEPRVPRWLLLLGILVTIEDFVWSLILNVFIVEWVTVALFLLYLLLLGIETKRNVPI